MWLKIVGFFSKLLNEILIPIGSKALSAFSGLPTIITNFILNYIGKVAVSDAESQARLADQKKIDDENRQKYVDDILQGKPKDELIKDETNLLNGNKP